MTLLLLENVSVRALGGDLVGAGLEHRGGVLAIVGAASDGAGALLGIAAGAVRPSRGTVKTCAPERIGYVPLAPEVPEALRVRELVDLAARIRGDQTAKTLDRLRAFGLEGMAERDTRTLSIVEARSVLACEALTSERVELVLLEEPLAKVLPSAASAIPRAIRDAKASVLVATASPDDARSLAEHFAILRKGRLLAIAGPLDRLTLLSAHGARLIANVSDAHAVAAALVDRTLRIGIEPNRLTLEGPDPEALARELQRAIVAANVDVESVRIEPLALEPLQIAATAQATAVYEAALARARAAAMPPAPVPVPIPEVKP